MWPTLISLGPISIHSFGVLVFLGLFFGSFKFWQKAKEEGWDETAVMDIWLLAGVVALVAGRLGFILSHWSQFGGSVYKMIFLTKFPGLAAEAAWLGGCLSLIILGLKKRLSLWPLLEAAALAMLILEIFTRLGSFLAGSNLGRIAPVGLGLPFPGVDQPRWPVQLFWVLGLAGGYLLLNHWEKRYRAYRFQEGFLAAVYLLLIGALTVGLGFLEEQRSLLWGAGLILAGSLILLLRSGITMKVPVKKQAKPKRKKRGFDYV